MTGAAGKTGRAVTASLQRRGVEVVPLVRGVVDLDTGVGLEHLRGCSAVYLIAPNVHPDEPGVVSRVLAAAKEHGVERVVYHSVAQPFAPAMPHHLDKARSEDLVRRSGLGWTVVQPCAYAQNLLDALRSETPALTVPYSVDSPFSFVDLEDVGEAVAVALTEPGHLGATYELGGPDALSVRDVAALAQDVLGTGVPASSISVKEWADGAGAALPDHARERLVAMFEYYDSYGLLTGSLVLQALLGRRPTCFAEVLRREL
ncbi:MAG TPA: NmrA family NAD(P)-binding protein [Actinomycetales bacterium]|nr:NmrA family NAD(P)-binding protein [Actinomycetales bacterium]